MKTLLEALYKRVMTTRDTRLEASRRMERCDRFSVSCIAFLSLEIIAINIFQFAETSDFDKYISAATIFLSVFALVLSLIVNQAQYALKAARYTACALALDELGYEINRLLKSKDTFTKDEVAAFETEYVSILKESNLNHEQCDYQWATRCTKEVRDARHFDANPTAYNCYRVYLWLNHWIFSTYFIYLLLTVIGAIIVGIFITLLL